MSSGTPEEVHLTLTDVPAGLSYTFKPSSGLPTYKSELTVTGSQTLPAATYTLTIIASDGEKERYKPILLTVEEGAEYQLTASPRTHHAHPGETVEYDVSVSSDTGYAQYVNLDISGLPLSVNGELTPSSIVPNSHSLLSVEVGSDAPPGLYSFTLRGSGPNPKRVILTLKISEETSPQQEEEKQQRDGYPQSYYLPLLYIGVIVAALIIGSVLGIRYWRQRPRKPISYCLECGKKIPVGVEFCPKCGAQQETR